MTVEDYKDILKFYKLPIPGSNKLIKKNAEKIITQKLCSCIKKVSSPKKEPKIDETRAIGICTESIVNRKGYTRGNFKCKKPKRNVTLKKPINKVSKTKSKSKSKTKSKSKSSVNVKKNESRKANR